MPRVKHTHTSTQPHCLAHYTTLCLFSMQITTAATPHALCSALFMIHIFEKKNECIVSMRNYWNSLFPKCFDRQSFHPPLFWNLINLSMQNSSVVPIEGCSVPRNICQSFIGDTLIDKWYSFRYTNQSFFFLFGCWNMVVKRLISSAFGIWKRTKISTGATVVFPISFCYVRHLTPT